MAGRGNEPQKVGECNIRRRGVFKRVAIEATGRLEFFVHNDRHPMALIVHNRKCGHRSGSHPQMRLQKIWLGKREPCPAELLGQPLEIDRCGAFGDNENKCSVFIFEEQIFGVRSRQPQIDGA